MYAEVKLLHMACAAISYGLFFLRGFWKLRQSPWWHLPWVRILPHGVDTLLLASALALAFMSSQYPLAQAWLSAKVVGLVLYIGLGMVAFRFGRRRSTVLSAWIGAQLVFAYIVGVAVSKHPGIFS